ncbi:MAG: extensin family protein [Janthinobacterium lividum]
MKPRARLTLGMLVVLALAGQASAVPLPVPRPSDSGPAGIVADVPLPVPRPEEDGPFLPPPRAPEVFGPFLPATRPAEAFGPFLPPLPPPRQGEVAGPPAPATPSPPPSPPEPDLTCGPLMASGKVVAQAATPIPDAEGCGIAAPLSLQAIVLRNGKRVEVAPPALMRCDLADRLADWLRDDVTPATATEGDLLGITDAAAYTCRSRNWTAGARISEHARGNAIDILSFRFAKRVVGLKGAEARDVLTILRTSACARFSTVLGPGADAFHETDLHLDLEHRRNDFKLCQWDVP